MNNIDIPLKYKCSYCKGDMRIKGYAGGCECSIYDNCLCIEVRSKRAVQNSWYYSGIVLDDDKFPECYYNAFEPEIGTVPVDKAIEAYFKVTERIKKIGNLC